MDYDESLAILAAAQHSIAAHTRSLDATTRRLEPHLQVLSRLQGLCIALVVVSVLGIGGLLWSLGVHVQQATAQHEALLRQALEHSTQTRDLLSRGTGH